MPRVRAEVEEGIPAFLRATKRDAAARKRRNEEWARAHPQSQRVEMPTPKAGVYPEHWLADPTTRELLAEMERERMIRRARREEKRREDNPLSDTTSLKKILGWLRDEGRIIKRRHAIAAIDAARLIHRKYHFEDAYVQDARRIIAAYDPPVKPRRERGPGAARQSVDPTAVVVARVRANPCRPGSARAGRVALLLAHCGGTVATYLAAGGSAGTLLKSAEFGWVRIESAAEAERSSEEKTSKRRKKS